MGKAYIFCNSLYKTDGGNVADYSISSSNGKIVLKLKESIFSNLNDILHPKKRMNDETSTTISPPLENDSLNIQPGEWVQINSIEEISGTLDERQKYDGLYFMPEMERFCGKKYKVFKMAEIIEFESTAEVRKLKKPVILLEGVYCDGEHHDGCDRACFHFWREIWLKRIRDVKT